MQASAVLPKSALGEAVGYAQRHWKALCRYPFPDEVKLLQDSKAVRGMHSVQIDAYWIDLMIGDLVRSAKKIRKQSLLDELDELCTVLEMALDDRPKLYVIDF